MKEKQWTDTIISFSTPLFIKFIWSYGIIKSMTTWCHSKVDLGKYERGLYIVNI